MKNYVVPTVILLGCIFLGGFIITHSAQAQYGSACSEYGLMVYESGGYCKCMSGYVMGKGVLGTTQCISENQACQDQYGYNARANYLGNCECNSGYVFQDGYSGKTCVSGDSICRSDYGTMSRYDSLSGKCECGYGYVFGEDSIGRTQCISDDKACQNQLGYHSRATYGGDCKCSSGYVIDGGECTDGNQVCHARHGYNSSYNDLSSKCECDDEYTLDESNSCVEKQHNVYFKLLDINQENEKELIIKSDYDSRKYKVSYGTGCRSYTIDKYIGKKLVVNLGTDYEVDKYDTLVLQDHDQTCSITYERLTYDDSFPEPEEEEEFYYAPPVKTHTPPSPTPQTTIDTTQVQNNADTTTNKPQVSDDELIEENIEVHEEGGSSTDEIKIEKVIEVQEEQPQIKENIFKRILNFFTGWF